MPARRPAGVSVAGGGTGTSVNGYNNGPDRRKRSLGNLRRAHPASGATWNVQVVRGKMSSKCLWHACRALVLGLTLMLLGAGMATIGYYADYLSMGIEMRGNATVRVKNDLKGFHLNNFSYVGPIVMGFGGFIVVASCVMTFEARDSAAKVVPARLRASGGSKTTVRSNQSSSASQRRAIGLQLQSSRWDQHFGVFRTSPANEQQQHQQPHQHPPPLDREALTAELIKFSKSLSGRQMKTRGTRISNSLVQRATRENASVCALLQPPVAPGNRLLWHAASFDESGRLEREFLRNIERTKRSDTAKRHVLARQKPIEHEEDKSSPLGNRRSSTMSDSSYSGRWTARCASIASHASSIDSRRVQVDLHSPEVVPKSILRSPKRYNSGPSATPSVEKEFRSQLSVCSEPPPMTVRQLSGQSSIEPCLPEETLDSPEEGKILANRNNDNSPTLSQASNKTDLLNRSQDQIASSNSRHGILKKPRPDSLLISASAGLAILSAKPSCVPATVETSTSSSTTSTSKTTIVNNGKVTQHQQQLQRSNSSRTFYRPKQLMPKDHDDSVFFIRSTIERSTTTSNSPGSASNELYDSLQVINERRSTLLRVESETALNDRRMGAFSLLQNIPERQAESQSQSTSIEIDETPTTAAPVALPIADAKQPLAKETSGISEDVKLDIEAEVDADGKSDTKVNYHK